MSASGLRAFTLDDDPERFEAFRLRFADVHHVHAWNWYEAVALISAWPAFSLWFLDHDLGTREQPAAGMQKSPRATWPEYAPPWEMTGFDLAKWAVACVRGPRRPKRVIVHSWNADGAHRMTRELTTAGFSVVPWRFNERELREREWP